MLRRSVRSDVEEFIAARSGRLLRAAYLLTGDRVRAETVLQVALARAWAGWGRDERDPDSVVRAAMVQSHVTWWHELLRGPSRHQGDAATVPPLWLALGGLSRRERGVLVLRQVEDVAETDTAEMLGCSVRTVRRLEAQAVAALATPDLATPDLATPDLATPDLATGLLAVAEDVAAASPDGPTIAERISQVEHRVDVRRAWRRSEVVLSLVVASAAAVAMATTLAGVSPPPSPPRVDPRPDIVESPPLLVGQQLAPVLRANNVDYEYFRSEESPPGREVLRVAVTSNRQPQALAWVSSSGLAGRLVVSVDGDVVSSDRAGTFESGLLMSARRPHVVVLRATRPNASMRLGVAVYRWPKP